MGSGRLAEGTGPRKLVSANGVDADPSFVAVGDLPIELHPQLLHDPPGGVIADLMDADDPVEPSIGEAEVHGRPGCFGGKAPTPELTTQAPAYFHRGQHLRQQVGGVESGEAGQPPSCADLDGEQPEAVGLPVLLAASDSGRGGVLVDGCPAADPPRPCRASGSVAWQLPCEVWP